MNSNWNYDLEQEAIMCDAVLNSYLLPYYSEKFDADIEQIKMKNSEREKSLQYQGVDFIAEHNSETKFLDLKAQTNNYINNPTSTFCLELDYYKDKQRREGWFLDESKITTDWMFMWINDSKFYLNSNKFRFISKPEDIYEYKLMLVNVEETKDWLSSYGLTEEYIRDIVEGMRSRRGKEKILEFNRGKKVDSDRLRVYYDLDEEKTSLDNPYAIGNRYISFVETGSNDVTEAPINLVISNKYWNEIAEGVYKYKDGEIIPVKEKLLVA